jgi:Tfp pilus assembly protein PilF
LDPQNAQAHFHLATAFKKAGHPDEANVHLARTAELKKAKLDFERAGMKTLNGIDLLRKGKPAEASTELREAVSAKPDYPEGHYYLAIALAQTGSEDESVKEFLTALAQRPQSAEIRYNFGIALWEMGRKNQATEQFKQATVLDPRHALAQCALGKALEAAGDREAGAKALSKARELGSCK